MKIIETKYGKNLLVIKNKNIETVTLLFQFKVGGVNEDSKTKGITHFLEHMVYKGNKKYKNGIQIIQKFNELGASENASNMPYTTQYFVKVHKDYQKEAFDLMKLCIFDSIFPVKELEQERNVISEELLKRRETPRTHVSDMMMSTVFKGTAYDTLIGLEKNVSKIKRSDMINFWKKYYNLNNCVIIVNGNIKDSLISDIKKLTSPIVKVSSPVVTFDYLRSKQKTHRINLSKRKLDQTTISISYPTFGYDSDKRYILGLIKTILRYRLFINIRSKKGLVYGVSCRYEYYDKCGSISIECGFDKKNLSKVVKIIFDTINNLKTKKITKKRLKDQIRYKINMRKMMYEDTIDTCEELVDEYLHTGKVQSIDQITKRMNKITEQDIMKVTKEIFDKNYLNLCVIGNHTKEEIEKLI